MQLAFIGSQTQARLSMHDPDLTQLQAFEPKQRRRAHTEKDRRVDDSSK